MNIIPVFVPHLGCPNDCVFCNQRAISGTMKPVTPTEVFENLTMATKVTKENFEVAFYGGSFTAICESLQNELLDVALKFTDNIRISTRPDYITESILLRLKTKGVKTIELGVQSMNDEVLARAKRGHTKKHAIHASKLIKEYGFILGIQMMIGLPLDNLETLLKSTDEMIALNPDIMRIYPIVVIEDTELYDDYKRGEYTPLSVEEAVKLSALCMEKINKTEIKVIRVGLNPTEDLSSSKAIAGAYHPAFGQLVSSRLYLSQMLKLKGEISDDTITFGVAIGEISTAIGNNACNKKYLWENYKLKLRVLETDIKKGEIILLS